MAKVDYKLDGLKCLIHDDQPAVFLCLNQQCQNSMRLYCQQCLGEGDNLLNKACLSQHLEDTLEVDSWSINKCYKQMQEEFMQEDEVYIRGILNLNYIKLEQLGRDTYRYLQERAYREVPRIEQSNQAQWSQESLEKFLQSQTSRYKLKEGVDALLQSISSETDENMEIEGGFEQLQAMKKQQQKTKLEAFKGCLDGMKSNLLKCQDMLSQQDKLVDIIMKQEVDEVFEKIKEVIENFISKKRMTRNLQEDDSTPNEPDRVGFTTRGSQGNKNHQKIRDESDEESDEDEEYKMNTNNNRKKKQSKKDKQKKNKKTKKMEQQHKSQKFTDDEVQIEPLASESQQKTNIFTKLLMKEMMQQQQSQNALMENNESQQVEESISGTSQMKKESPKEQQTQELRESQYQSQQTDLSQDSQQTQSLQLNSQLSGLKQKEFLCSQEQEKSAQKQFEVEEIESSNYQENQHQNQLDSHSQKQFESQSRGLNSSQNNLLETAADKHVDVSSQPQNPSVLQRITNEQLALSDDLKKKIKKIQDSSIALSNKSKHLKLADENASIQSQESQKSLKNNQKEQITSNTNAIDQSIYSKSKLASKNDSQQQYQSENHLVSQSSPSDSVSTLIHPTDTVSFSGDHKISRLILNASSTMMIAVCGGWQKSSGKAFLLDLDYYYHTKKNILKTKKMFSSPQCQFTDGVFSLCDNYVCLAAQTGIHVFSTSSEQPGEKQTAALLKIDTNYSVRSLIINPARILKNEKICYELILGGNLHFGIAHIEHTMKNPQILQDLPVKGQIECIDFIAQNKYAVFTIFELQILQCYDFEKNKIIFSSKSLGFDPWSMQINQLKNQIFVAGEDEFIHLFQFNPLRATISSLRKIKLYHNDVIISFAFYQHLLFIATSDYAFQVLQQKDEKQLEYTPFYFTDDEDHLMPNLAVSAKHNCVYVASQLAKITSYQIS